MSNIQARKSSAKIQLVDKNGKPLANKTFSFNQTKHEFLFGCGAFDSVVYANNYAPDKQEFFKERMDKWLEIFNYGTLPFYWGGYEREEGKPNKKGLMAAAKFLDKNYVTVKGHPLCWHTACAPWLIKYDDKTILEKQLERIRRDVSAFKGTIDIWDVINEVVIMPIYDKYDNAITRICKMKGRVGLVKEVFKTAKETNPDGMFLINDFNLSTNYEILIDGCLQAGAPITCIGLQSHQHQGVWSRDKLEEILARFEHFGLPIHFTENTIVSGPKVPAYITDLQDWHYEDGVSTPKLEDKQASDMEKMYRAVFEEHPLVTGFTTWDFSDGAWLNAPSGFIRKDNSEKPSFQMLKGLVKDEWWTKAEYTTDAKGYATVEGFKGEYIISCGSKKADFILKEKKNEKKIVL